MAQQLTKRKVQGSIASNPKKPRRNRKQLSVPTKTTTTRDPSLSRKTNCGGSQNANKPLPRPTARARFAGIRRERLRLERSVEMERTKRLAVYRQALKKLEDSRSRKALALGVVAKPVLTILAEGDSWFDYSPGKDVLDALFTLTKIPIAKMADASDEVRKMLSLKQRAEITKRLRTGASNKRPWDILLFSGGGNDFVGDELCIWLRQFVPGMTADQVIDTERFDAVLAIVKAGYSDLISIRNAISPNTKIFVHQYDFAPPNGQDICNVGPWLKPSLDFRGVPPEMQPDVVKELLLRFAAMLTTIAPVGSNVFIVPTQGTFPAQTKTWWANELHPSDRGFQAIATKFLDALRTQFPGQI